MNFKVEKLMIPEHKTIYTLELFDFEWVLSKLDQVDFQLIRECEKSSKISDKLLALQVIALRYEQFREACKLKLDESNSKLL